MKNEGSTFLIGDFDDGMETDTIVPLTKEIERQSRSLKGRIDLYVNSFGGYSHLAFHLVELVEHAKRNGVTVRTIIPGVAFSAGSMVAVAGSPGERYISKTGEHLIHYGSIGSIETTPTQVARYRAWKDRDFKNVVAHYRKYADVPDLEEHMQDDGFFIPSRLCIKYQLADKYIDKLELIP